MNSILIVAILFISAFVSGIAVFFVRRENTNMLKLILSFSGAYLFSITVLHLIPHVYHTHSSASETIGLFVLLGFIFQLVLEQFSHGIEHGHIHHSDKSVKGILPWGIMISLCLHALLEGMPLASHHQHELVFGIAVHHIPAAFALGSLLLHSAASRRSIIILLAIFAFMTPLGFLISKGISSGGMGGGIEQYFDRIMAVVIGIFLHISTTILFESGTADHHQFNRKKMIAVALGIAISLLNFMFDSHSHTHAH
ncbi:ZIP family metal transporter [Parapedobacter deserti]|uniref:ZIP family metal transporter n=1 Tax=Parapedobacter deserti TaxID=1912957 RepID=A0ABV7JH60_9SPHI